MNSQQDMNKEQLKLSKMTESLKRLNQTIIDGLDESSRTQFINKCQSQGQNQTQQKDNDKGQ